ncbi:transposase, partial [Alkalibacterium sp. m-11]
SNIKKEEGVSVTAIVTFLFTVAFHGGKSMNQLVNDSERQPGFGKDTVNRFLKNERFNWRTFLLLLSEKVIATLIPYVQEDNERVLILDDSMFSRNRSKKVELLAKNYDHASGKYMK